ncbi:MAG: nucleotidyltransferase domain-containing protein [Bacteroidales bacterium]|nr:nucleotidyltransferase domain-containing protein [Bacteroidales bacterium]
MLSSIPVTKAWLFGSYSRMEERPDSDIDLLVDLDRKNNVGLFEIGKIAFQLENAVGVIILAVVFWLHN